MSIMKRGFVVFSAVCLALVSAGAASAGRSRPVVDPNSRQQAKLMASDGAARDYFGHAVAISADGNFAISGAWGRTKGTGAAFTFANSGGVWTQQAKLGPSDLVAGDQFGSVGGHQLRRDDGRRRRRVEERRSVSRQPRRQRGRVRLHAVGEHLDAAGEAHRERLRAPASGSGPR